MLNLVYEDQIKTDQVVLIESVKSNLSVLGRF